MSKPKYKWWSYVKNICRDYHRMKQGEIYSAQDRKELEAVDAALAEVEDGTEREVVTSFLNGEKSDEIAEAKRLSVSEVRNVERDFMKSIAYEMGLYRPTLRK